MILVKFQLERYERVSRSVKSIQTLIITGFKSVAYSESADWKDYGADGIIKMVVENKHLDNGSIILMHNGAKYTTEVLEGVIKGLKEKDYRIVPISQLIYDGEYTVDSEGRQFRK